MAKEQGVGKRKRFGNFLVDISCKTMARLFFFPMLVAKAVDAHRFSVYKCTVFDLFFPSYSQVGGY